MQNSGLILSTTSSSQESTLESTDVNERPWQRSLVIHFWLVTVATVMLYATFAAF